MSNSVLVGLSGGIDSAMSVYYLKEKGYKVKGVFFNLVSEVDNLIYKNLKEISKMFNINVEIIDLKNEFKKNVIDYYLREYSLGNTPSPCVMCNENIKFRYLYEFSDSRDYISTGHYARVGKLFGEYLLTKPFDLKKDQTYMLGRVAPNTLKRMIFPLSKINKTKLFEIAKELNLSIYKNSESQGLCFAKKGYIDYLNNNLKNLKEGWFINEEGVKLGKHKGYLFYTIGQRRGLGINLGKPIFVLDIIPEKNLVILGEYEKLYKKEIKLKNVVLHIDYRKIKNMKLLCKSRFSSSGFMGKLIFEGQYKFCYDYKNTHNARGQIAVFYYDNFVVGSGIIE